MGMPGSRPTARMTTPTISKVRGNADNCRTSSRPSSPSDEERVTIRPVPTEITSAGIWVTMPSPIVNKV